MLLSACAGAPPPVDESLVPYASDADAIRLPDGRALNLVCMGSGSPTVILTAGLGDFTGWAWSTVQPQMAETTRVCAWDRPGFGLSDGVSTPQTVATTLEDLDFALSSGKYGDRFVMVGHSMGSFDSLMFTDRHLDQVVGMVLVDPSSPAAIDPKLELPIPDAPEDEATRDNMLRDCVEQRREGQMDESKCLEFPTFFPPELTEALGEKVIGSALQYESQLSFNESIAQSQKLALNPERNYGAMPMIVLGQQYSPRYPPGTSEEFKAALTAVHKRDDQRKAELAALSTRGEFRKIADAGHYIQKDQPQVVIDAVAEVVAVARAASD